MSDWEAVATADMYIDNVWDSPDANHHNEVFGAYAEDLNADSNGNSSNQATK